MFRTTLLAICSLALALGQQPQPQWKNQAEFEMFSAAQKERDPRKILALTDAWKAKYPDTQFQMARLQLYLNAYQQLNDVPNLLTTLNLMLALDPKDLGVLSPIMYYTMLSSNPTPAALDMAAKAAAGALANIDNKPAGVNDEQWPQAKKQIESLAHKTLGWVAMQRKDNAAAQQEFLKTLQLDPNQGEVDFWLGNTLRTEKTAEKISQALFYYARAATYAGPGSLTEQERRQLEDFLQKAYTKYHGEDQPGLDQLKTAARAQSFPPAGFIIKSAQEIAEEKAREFAEKNPQLALWMSVKKELTGADGAQYFESQMKGTKLPPLKGTLISAKPALRPRELVIGIADPKTPEVTLRLDTPLTGRVETGGEIEFEGIATHFSPDPFNVTLDVEKAAIKGLRVKRTR